MSRDTISSMQLYAILDREFKKLGPRRCECRAPLPYYRTPPDDVSANWSVTAPRECPAGCHKMLAELVTRLWTRYDIEPERPQ